MRKITFMAFAAYLFILLTFLPGVASGGQEILRVSVTGFPPWKYKQEDGSWGGIDIGLLELLAERMNLRLEVTEYPWDRGLHMLKTGKVDMVTSLLRRPEREKFVHFIEPPYLTGSAKAFYVLKGNEQIVTDYVDLRDLRIGTNTNVKYFERFDSDNSLNKQAVRSDDQLFNMLLKGRTDTFIYTESAGDWIIAMRGLENRVTKAQYKYIKKQNVYLVLSKRSKLAHRLDEFSRILGELINEGAVNRLKKQYHVQ